MKYTLAFSPCPNDTFIFDAMVNGKIDTGGISFDVQLEDVQTLNEWALAGRMDFSKISYGVLHLVKNSYHLLNSGGALGKGVGPLLVSKNKAINPASISELSIAIPGKNTTANLLFSWAFPAAKNKVFKVFHEIEDAVLSGEVDAGVIIHENRFTYAQKGLEQLADLGAMWEAAQNIPIPLGGIIAKKSIPSTHIYQVDRLIRKSVEYAFSLYPVIPTYVREHAQTMNVDIVLQHIDLYVNKYSINLGKEGRNAVELLEKIALEQT